MPTSPEASAEPVASEGTTSLVWERVEVPAGETRAELTLRAQAWPTYRSARTLRLRLVDVVGAEKRDPAYCYVTTQVGQEVPDGLWPRAGLASGGAVSMGPSGTSPRNT